ncbi:MAG TPA: hypothetical protein VEF89_30545 [Solirubrobacteraceae bacterium]|nr:hypothetical protein [Solirubrobacteraceae bacterium]
MAASEAMLLNLALSADALTVLAPSRPMRMIAGGTPSPGRSCTSCASVSWPARGSSRTRRTTGPSIPHRCSSSGRRTTTGGSENLATLRGLRPALDGALRWIDEYGDRDGDGFVEYERRSPEGLHNQGWKDSHDSVVHADGARAEGPIALVEVQGYVYMAKLAIAYVYDALGAPEAASRLRDQAQVLRARFNEAFWNPEEGTFALALDGRKRQVASVSSNPALFEVAIRARDFRLPELYCGFDRAERASVVAYPVACILRGGGRARQG